MNPYFLYTVFCFEIACVFQFEFSEDQEGTFHLLWYFFMTLNVFSLGLKPARGHENIVLWDEINRISFACFYVSLLYVCVGCIQYFCSLD